MDIERLGLIAGNGKFPFLVLEEAARRKISLVVAAIKEETLPEIEELASRIRVSQNARICVHWLGLGQLEKLIRLFRERGVVQVVMAGQVKHRKIFASKMQGKGGLSALPDWKMTRLLLSLSRKNTQSLIGGVASVLSNHGIELLDSTYLLRESLATAGVITRRAPNRKEREDIEYGRPLARQLAQLDLGQSVVVRDRAVVAIEAMEGTDETIRRAARLVGSQRLTLVKMSRPNQDMRFDVPVIGLQTLQVLEQCHVSAMAIDAGRTLILDHHEFVRKANGLEIAIVAD